ncbi:DUF3040 domain-containing protein [Actinomycetospora straminea]|uniref:DUF3040 family protein n=1 Tax=Actinomycetospora straminea TaxID=663607 RepID=A0ABP9EQ78_9PSEU|nr:DUF3040 domain-containing protein [Actinomycetospora straminea]MDD7933518.1 DUF3040 domain-containing protein [Actinomycetospora straminea]
MTMPGLPEPSHEPRPLSERERRALLDLEARLADEDPARSLRLRPQAAWRAHVSDRAVNLLVQVAVVVVVLVVVLPGPWAAALVAVTLMVVPGTISLLVSREEYRRRREQRERGAHPESGGGES